MEKIVGPSIYYLVLQSTDSSTITNPTTPTDDSWETTSPGDSKIENWLVPGILVIIITGSIFALIRARNKREYTDERRRHEINSEINSDSNENDETDYNDLVEQYREKEKLGYSFGLEDEKVDK